LIINQRVLTRQSIAGYSRWQSFSSHRNFERTLPKRGVLITWINYSTVYGMAYDSDLPSKLHVDYRFLALNTPDDALGGCGLDP
jgi:hypothetical protein